MAADAIKDEATKSGKTLEELDLLLVPRIRCKG